jgi:hypothetical protein
MVPKTSISSIVDEASTKIEYLFRSFVELDKGIIN